MSKHFIYRETCTCNQLFNAIDFQSYFRLDLLRMITQVRDPVDKYTAYWQPINPWINNQNFARFLIS